MVKHIYGSVYWFMFAIYVAVDRFHGKEVFYHARVQQAASIIYVAEFPEYLTLY